MHTLSSIWVIYQLKYLSLLKWLFRCSILQLCIPKCIQLQDMFTIVIFRLLHSLGQSKLFSAESCKNIKAANEYIIKTNSLLDDCTPSFGNRVYWIQNLQVPQFIQIKAANARACINVGVQHFKVIKCLCKMQEQLI